MWAFCSARSIPPTCRFQPLSLPMPPVKGETAFQRAARLDARSTELRDKARFQRVSEVLKKDKTALYDVELMLIRKNLIKAEDGATPVPNPGQTTRALALTDGGATATGDGTPSTQNQGDADGRAAKMAGCSRAMRAWSFGCRCRCISVLFAMPSPCHCR